MFSPSVSPKHRRSRSLGRHCAALGVLVLGFLVPGGRAAPAAGATPHVLRVVADPNNLPFSNRQEQGFENRLVTLIAQELGARVEYTWWAQRRGWVRQTLKERDCDIVAGVPPHLGPLLTTRPYYRSTYVLLSRRDRGLQLPSLDAPALRQLRIGVQMIGDDFANTPPAHALSRRGLITNIRGYTVYGDYAEANPPARIVDAVLDGTVDVACVWGPLAGFMAREHPGQLTLAPLPARDALSGEPFAFDICIGVRRSEPALRDAINAILVRRRADIEALLDAYGVPRLPLAPTSP